MKKWLIHLYISFKETIRNLKLDKECKIGKARIEADIIRYSHSIEKGLCLSQPRYEFGFSKIKYLFGLIEKYIELDKTENFCVLIAIDTLCAYIKFHEENNFNSEKIEEIKKKLHEVKQNYSYNEGDYGGIQVIDKKDLNFNTEEIERFFASRHSVREYSGEPINEKDIVNAIKMAQFCPSACNRQGVRVYRIESQKFFDDMNTKLEGVGGFAQDTDSFLLVTGKKSAYEVDERNQYIVSASIFAGYLSLTLHLNGIAACAVQRSVSPNEQWEKFKKINNIDKDEQIVIMFAIGKYKEKTKVPISKRYPIEKIYRKI